MYIAFIFSLVAFPRSQKVEGPDLPDNSKAVVGDKQVYTAQESNLGLLCER
jgi:hypothetical protein